MVWTSQIQTAYGMPTPRCQEVTRAGPTPWRPARRSVWTPWVAPRPVAPIDRGIHARECRRDEIGGGDEWPRPIERELRRCQTPSCRTYARAATAQTATAMPIIGCDGASTGWISGVENAANAKGQRGTTARGGGFSPLPLAAPAAIEPAAAVLKGAKVGICYALGHVWAGGRRT